MFVPAEFCQVAISIHKNVTWQHQHPLFVLNTAELVAAAELPNNTCSETIH